MTFFIKSYGKSAFHFTFRRRHHHRHVSFCNSRKIIKNIGKNKKYIILTLRALQRWSGRGRPQKARRLSILLPYSELWKIGNIIFLYESVNILIFSKNLEKKIFKKLFLRKFLRNFFEKFFRKSFWEILSKNFARNLSDKLFWEFFFFDNFFEISWKLFWKKIWEKNYFENFFCFFFEKIWLNFLVDVLVYHFWFFLLVLL